MAGDITTPRQGLVGAARQEPDLTYGETPDLNCGPREFNRLRV
jgi:hypothetical protein